MSLARRARSASLPGRAAVALALVCLQLLCGRCAGGFLDIKDGYFLDKTTNERVFLHGLTYQTSLGDIGEWQSPLQMEVDIRHMMMANVNSIRVDFVWRGIEFADNMFNWNTTDLLIQLCKRYSIRLFPVIGYQWPPEWVTGSPFDEAASVNALPDYGLFTMSPPGPGPALQYPPRTYTRRWVSEEISLENTLARQQFREFVQAVAARYANEELIGGWIIGSQFGYIGALTRRQQGYDPPSVDAFRLYLQNKFQKASTVKERWGENDPTGNKYTFTSFTTIPMPEAYTRDHMAWYDLIAWREQSVAAFVRDAAVAVRSVDTTHLIGYATGSVYSGPEDWRYNAEDLKQITTACATANAPLNFIGLNLYPNLTTGSELRSTRWAFERVRWQTGLPILVTEVGVSSSDPALSTASDPFAVQSLSIRIAVWEAVVAGAIGVHIFNFNDRVWFPLAERGFGMVQQDRFPKAALSAATSVFDSIDDADMTEMLPKSTRNTKPEILFYWTSATDQMISRYTSQMAGLFGALTRLGFDCTFADEKELSARLDNAALRPKAVVLPRNRRMFVGDLKTIMEKAQLYGVHVYADGDLPYSETERITKIQAADFTTAMETYFGVTPDVLNAYTDTAASRDYVTDSTNGTLAPVLLNGGGAEPSCVYTWQYSRVNVSGNATVLAYMRLAGDAGQVSLCPGIARGDDNIPAIVVRSLGGTAGAKAAIAVFGFAGVASTGLPVLRTHFDWYNIVFRGTTGFNIRPGIRVTGPAREYVSVDWRKLSNGDFLVFVMFWQDAYLSSTTQRITISMDILTTAEHLRNVATLQRVNLATDSATSKSFTVQVDPLTTLVLRSRTTAIVRPTILVRSQPLDDGRLQYPTAVTPNGQLFPYSITVDYLLPTIFAGAPETYSCVGEIIYGTPANPILTWTSTETVPISGSVNAVTLTFQIPDPNLAGPYGVNSTYLGGTFHVRGRIIVRDTNKTANISKARPVSVDWGVWPLSYPQFGKTEEVVQRPAVGKALAGQTAYNPNPLGYTPLVGRRRKLKQTSENTREIIKMAWNWMLPDQMRRDANPYRVLLYNSTKTSTLFDTHQTAVSMLAQHMDQAGYYRLTNFKFKDEYALRKQGKKIYFVLDDNWVTDGTTGTTAGVTVNLDPAIVATYFKIIVFPNVYVMNRLEIANFARFMLGTFNARVISTSSCVGCMLPDGTRDNTLATLLGFEENSYIETNGLSVGRTVDPDYDGIGARILRTLESADTYDLYYARDATREVKPAAASIPMYARPNIVDNGLRPTVLAVFKGTIVPAMVLNRFGQSAASVTFNYDACNEPLGSPTDLIWRDVLSWAQQAGAPFQKMRFSSQCPPIPPVKPFKVYENSYDEIWVDVGRGNRTFVTGPNAVWCEEPVFFGFTYDAELASQVIDLYDVRITQYSSQNDSAWYLLPLGPSPKKKQDPYYIVWGVTAGVATVLSVTVRLVVFCVTKM